MKKIIIDTNSLISFVTDRSPIQQEKVAILFESAAHLKLSIICHQNVITEFVYVMEKIYGIKKEKISELILDFINLPGVELAYEIDIKTVLKIWPSDISDFVDAIIAALCLKTKNTSIATFDKKFKSSLTKLTLPIYSF